MVHQAKEMVEASEIRIVRIGLLEK